MSDLRKVSVIFYGLPLEVSGYYYKGCPEHGPTYSCGGTPAEPAEFDIKSVSMHGHDFLPLLDAVDSEANPVYYQLEELALEVVECDDGYEEDEE